MVAQSKGNPESGLDPAASGSGDDVVRVDRAVGRPAGEVESIAGSTSEDWRATGLAEADLDAGALVESLGAEYRYTDFSSLGV